MAIQQSSAQHNMGEVASSSCNIEDGASSCMYGKVGRNVFVTSYHFARPFIVEVGNSLLWTTPRLFRCIHGQISSKDKPIRVNKYACHGIINKPKINTNDKT
jgi:hypothetical protein